MISAWCTHAHTCVHTHTPPHTLALTPHRRAYSWTLLCSWSSSDGSLRTRLWSDPERHGLEDKGGLGAWGSSARLPEPTCAALHSL